MKPVCKECGSHWITRDAVVDWDDYHKIWKINEIRDCTECLDCGATGDYLIEWTDDTGEEV